MPLLLQYLTAYNSGLTRMDHGVDGFFRGNYI